MMSAMTHGVVSAAVMMMAGTTLQFPCNSEIRASIMPVLVYKP